MSVIDITPNNNPHVLAERVYVVDLDEGRRLEAKITHRRGYDSTWGSCLVLDADDKVLDHSPLMRYLSYDCDTEIVAATTGNLSNPDIIDPGIGIWQFLSDQIPECRCDLDDEDDQ